MEHTLNEGEFQKAKATSKATPRSASLPALASRSGTIDHGSWMEWIEGHQTDSPISPSTGNTLPGRRRAFDLC